MHVTRTALVVPLNRIFTGSIALIAMTCFGAALSLSLVRAAYRRIGYDNIQTFIKTLKLFYLVCLNYNS
jgi:hypothetical protein